MASRPSYLGSTSADEAVAGVTAGAVSTLLVQPLDMVKVRLQVQDGRVHQQQYKNLRDAFRTIVRQEGALALYQGLTPNLVGATLAWGSYFAFYDKFKRQLSNLSPGRGPLGPGHHMAAAALAGILTQTLTNPIWVIKTRLCIQRAGDHNAYSGFLHAFRAIARDEGIRGFYRGFSMSLLSISHGSLQFVAYEELKRMFQTRPDERLSTAKYLFMASTSKIFAAAGTYPFQVMRARLQDRSAGATGRKALDVLKATYRYEGVFGFYKGLTASVARVLPATCVTFLVYENVGHVLRDLARNESPRK